MPKIAAIIDFNGRPMYYDYGQTIKPLKAKKWYVHTDYTQDPSAFHVKICSSRSAAEKWVLAKRRIKEYGENAEFYIFHA